MPIRIHCPNTACGQVITVPDDYAGKRGKCVSCGTAMTVPSSASRETVLLPPPTETSRPRREEVAEVIEPVTVTTADAIRLPSADAAEPVEASPLPAESLPPALVRADLTARAALIVVLSALVVLSFLPQVPWVHVSESSRAGPGSPQTRELLFLIGTATGSSLFSALLLYSALLAFLAAMGLISLELLPADQSSTVIVAASGLAGAWGVTVLLLTLGYIIKAFVVRREIGTSHLTILPGIGPVLGLVASLVLLTAAGYLLTSRKRFLWLASAVGLGLFFGIFLLIFSARPWEPWRVG